MKELRVKTEIVITPEQRRHIQLIQLEMLLEIDRICRKYQIPYRLIGGSLIGAVRHQGFIPWDPDADISMNRIDYNLFFEVCKDELDKDKFFLQEWRTDPKYRWNYARMLRNNTEFVRAGHENIEAKNGVFVDIICADRVPDSKVLRPLHCFSCYVIRKTLWSKVGKELHPKRLLRTWYTILSLVPRDAIFKFRDWVITWTGDKPTQLTRNMAHKVSAKSPSRWGYPRKIPIEDGLRILTGELPWDFHSTDLIFEGYKLMATKFYEEGLRSTFGDYMKMPPQEQRNSHIPCARLKLIRPEIPEFDLLMKKLYTE
ncbi:LicD family protein [Paenibacillus camerounensis]|uniref:LicD family protein n=1 Tax=Paenibacillus camerounensis TaxID=1243663 RepID=UPI00069457BD|nr:LicD family protein [Paenibacillus camerounensis]